MYKRQSLPIEVLQNIRTDTVLVNAGHGGDEIEVMKLVAAAVQAVEVGAHCTRYRLQKNGPWFSVLGGGHPLNIVMNSGSPEPVLLHFALLGLTLEWITERKLAPGEIGVPPSVEEEAARMALSALAPSA